MADRYLYPFVPSLSMWYATYTRTGLMLIDGRRHFPPLLRLPLMPRAGDPHMTGFSGQKFISRGKTKAGTRSSQTCPTYTSTCA